MMTKGQSKKIGGLRRRTITCVDLFCGLGGLTHGLVRGGVHVVAGVDVDPQPNSSNLRPGNPPFAPAHKPHQVPRMLARDFGFDPLQRVLQLQI
jgi:hypothetical protein